MARILTRMSGDLLCDHSTTVSCLAFSLKGHANCREIQTKKDKILPFSKGFGVLHRAIGWTCLLLNATSCKVDAKQTRRRLTFQKVLHRIHGRPVEPHLCMGLMWILYQPCIKHATAVCKCSACFWRTAQTHNFQLNTALPIRPQHGGIRCLYLTSWRSLPMEHNFF